MRCGLKVGMPMSNKTALTAGAASGNLGHSPRTIAKSHQVSSNAFTPRTVIPAAFETDGGAA
jgi:hypothetical protein